MIRAVDYQKVDMSDDEWAYYQELIKMFSVDSQNGSEYFKNLFVTNEKGIITIIKPSKPIPYEVIFFVMNLQQNQHLREFDARLEAIECEIKYIRKGE